MLGLFPLVVLGGILIRALLYFINDQRNKQMNINANIVKHVAKLSKISLDDREIEQLTQDLANIVEFVEKINEVNTDNVEPLTSVIDKTNVLREDIHQKSLPTEITQRLAPQSQSGHIVVPSVIEQ